MKICMITPTFLPKIGGAEYQVKWLVEKLVKKNHEVILMVPKYSEKYVKENFELASLEGRLEYYFLDVGKVSGHFNNIQNIYTYIKQTQPDIIHIHFLYPWGFYLYLLRKFRLTNIPIVVTSHGIDLIRNKDLKDYYQNSKLKSNIIKLVSTAVDKVVVVSKAMQNDAVASGVPLDKLEVIHNGYIPKRYPNAKLSEIIDNIKTKYLITDDYFVIVAIGRLHKQKGFLYLVKAFKKLIKNKINESKLKLFIIGDGDYKKELLKFINNSDSDNIILTGFVDDLTKQAFLSMADIYCMPSVWEGMPLSLFDPMYFGIPIVATNVGGIPEVVEHNKHAILVPPKSVEGLYNALKRLIENETLRIRLGRNARKRLKLFSMDTVAERYIKLYKEVI